MASASDSHAAQRPVAVFDSGVGGLTVLHELLVALPHEDFVYLGDTARFPYGSRTPQELRGYALEIAEELAARGAKLLVIACNSASAATLRDARELFASSAVARAAFGDEVVEHYLNYADVELAAFDAAVTDWERFRGFERL